MISRLLRLWPLVFFLLALSSHTVQAKQRSDGVGRSPATSEDASVQKPLAGQHDADVAVPGAASFNDAQAILSRLKAQSKRSSHFIRPTGFIGFIFYYLKELFVLLFLKGSPNTVSSSSSSAFSSRKLNEPLKTAVQALESAAVQNNTDAIFTIADLNFYGRYGYPRNFSRAFQEYDRLALMNGNASAQHMLGFMYSTGIGGAVQRDQPKAMLYHKFAADGGDTRSQMTIGYRYHTGIATPPKCEQALRYYKKVADKAIIWMRTGPPGGRQIDKETIRFADDDGGIYGEGASVSSAGRNAKQGGVNSDAHAAFDDVLEYLDLMSRKGELKATFGLARLHYEGSRNLPQDYVAAREFFLDIARRYWRSDGKIKADVEDGVEKLAAKAAGYLGRMFLRGEGVAQDFKKARIWLQRGVSQGDALSQYSLGIMNLHGLGQESPNPVLAAEFFGSAADQKFASAQVRLGSLMLDQGDVASATKYFDIAAGNGHIEAYYYLAELANLGNQQRERSCSTASLFYKIVAEKAEDVHSDFKGANLAYDSGDLDTALVAYMQAAEQGYEVGQANVAYLLDRPYRAATSHLARFLPSVLAKKHITPFFNDPELALIYWTRSARQSNVDSLVKMGDYYLNNIGVASASVPSPPVALSSSSPPPPSFKPQNQTSRRAANAQNAAVCYTAAADTHQSAQAFWNLGWMHENGLGGLAQDFHLAKRYYDQSLETNAEAYLPVTIALIKLRWRSRWNSWTGGKAVSIKTSAEDDRKLFSWTEWLARFIQADLEQYEEQLRRDGLDDDGGEWDPAAAAAGQGGRYGDDVMDDGTGFGGELWIDEGLMEFIVIAGIAMALAGLVYYRQMMLLRARQRDDEQRRHVDAGDAPQGDADAEDRGMFPPPEDPNFNQWLAGGVGH